MSWNLMRGIALGLALCFALPTVADAQPDPDKIAERRKKRDEARKDRRERVKDRAEKRDELRKDRRERAKDRAEKRDELRKDRRERIKDRAKKRDEIIKKRRALVDAYLAGASPEELKKKHDELIGARKDIKNARKKARARRKERVKALLEEAGIDVNKAAVTAELRVHSRRVARLARIRELAVAAGDEALQKRVDEIAAKEDARHKARMAKLTGEGSKKEE